jgi:hypothetical protein
MKPDNASYKRINTCPELEQICDPLKKRAEGASLGARDLVKEGPAVGLPPLQGDLSNCARSLPAKMRALNSSNALPMCANGFFGSAQRKHKRRTPGDRLETVLPN